MMADQVIASIEVDVQPHKKRRRSTTKDPDRPWKKPTPKQSPVSCPVCLDLVPPSKLHRLSACDCKYCTQCLIELFESGLSNKGQNFPSTCCGYPLNLDMHEKKLPQKLQRAYRLAMEEMMSNDPVYCANDNCRVYISSDSVKDGFGTCGSCHMKTCQQCKMLKKDHLGKFIICPIDLEDEQLQELAMSQGWKRCPSCYAITEKVFGCDSIRCKCRHMWCYACGKSEKLAEDGCTCFPPPVLPVVNNITNSIPLEDESTVEDENGQDTQPAPTPENVLLTTEGFFDFAEGEILPKDV